MILAPESLIILLLQMLTLACQRMRHDISSCELLASL